MARLKIRDEHFAHLKSEIDSVLERYGFENLKEEYETGNFPRSEKVKDLNKRFCFDMLFGAGLNSWVCDELYPYMSDEHVYSALKKIIPTIERRY